MKNISEKLFCGGCGHPVIWKKLEPIYQKSSLLVPEPKVLYYKHKCSKCKIITEFFPDIVRDTWLEENPDAKVIIKL